jgi:hypothetical protein
MSAVGRCSFFVVNLPIKSKYYGGILKVFVYSISVLIRVNSYGLKHLIKEL